MADCRSFETCATLAVLGLLVHQAFRRNESYRISAHAFLLLPPPAAVFIYRLLAHATFPVNPVRDLGFCYAIYFLSLIFSILAYRASPLHPLSRYPGPFWCKLSMFWHAFQISVTGKQNRYIQSLHERYGDIVRMGPNLLSIRDAEMIPALLGPSGVGKGSNFVGAMLCEEQVPMVGIQNIEEHLHRRRAWARGLGPAALKEHEHLIVKRTRQLVGRLGEQKGEVVLGQWFNGWSYDFMCDMAFGGGSEIMAEGDKGNVWRVIEEGVVVATFLGQLPWLGIYIGYIPAAVKTLDTFLMLGRNFATKRVERGSTTRDLFHYLNDEDLPDRPAPPLSQLVDDGILAIVAGSDTVSSSLTSMFCCLLTHPDAYAKVRAEVDQFYPPGEDVYDTKYHRDMTYLQAVINETVRLFPPVMTSSPRKVPNHSHGVQIGSTYLPPGTSFVIPPWSLHHDGRNFSFPHSFWPERWLVASGKLRLKDAPLPCEPSPLALELDRRPYGPKPQSHTSAKLTELEFTHNETAFMAFSHGPMNCVGKGLAMQELRTVVCALVQNFEFTLREGWDPKTYGEGYKDYFVATRPEVPVTLRRREQ